MADIHYKGISRVMARMRGVNLHCMTFRARWRVPIIDMPLYDEQPGVVLGSADLSLSKIPEQTCNFSLAIYIKV